MEEKKSQVEGAESKGEQVDDSKRNIVAALLGGLGVAALSSCTNQTDPDQREMLAQAKAAIQGNSGLSAMRWCQTMAELRAWWSTPTWPQPQGGDICVLEGYWGAGDGGGGVFFWDESTHIDDGGTTIVPTPTPPPPTTALHGPCWRRIYSGPLNVNWFGAVGNNNAVTDTDGINRAISTAIQSNLARAAVEIPNGQYRVTGLLIEGANGLQVNFNGGLILGPTSGPISAILTVKNSTDVSLTGKVWISGQANPSLCCAIWIYSDNPQIVAGNTSICNPVIVDAPLAFRFGHPAEPDIAVSEISVTGGFTYSCPSVVEAYGFNTVVSFNGTNLVSNANGHSEDPRWIALPQVTIMARGAHVFVSGGEVQHNSETAGSALCIQPIESTTLGNRHYGSIWCHGAEIESAGRLGIAENPHSVQSVVAGSGALLVHGCYGYHSQDAFPFIETSEGFDGRVTVKDSKFRAGPVRQNNNILAHGSASIYVDAQSFGDNFIQGLAGISGGVAHFDRRAVLVASNTGGQTLPCGVATTVIWQSVLVNADTARFGACYSSATGVFTVPAGGLDDVEVEASLRTDQPASALEVDVYVGGQYAGSLPMMMGGSGNHGVALGSWRLGRLEPNATVEIKATQFGQPSHCNYGSYERMVVYARC